MRHGEAARNGAAAHAAASDALAVRNAVVSGYLGGGFDLVSQRVTEVFESFPDLILAMAISRAIGTGMRAVIVAIAITRLPFGNRVIRSVALTIREQSYVEAARAAGASQLRVMALHVLPQCLAPYLVLATTHLGVAIIIEAALGFLGVGIPPPTPTWGSVLADSLTSLVPHWWLVLFPGAAITVTRARLQHVRRRHPRHPRPEAVAGLTADDGGRQARRALVAEQATCESSASG